MIDTKTVRSWIGDELRSAGLERRGVVWRLLGADVLWLVYIDRVPFSRRLGVEIGLDLRADSTAERPTDCPIVLYLGSLLPTRDLWVFAALDLNSGLDDAERRQELGAALRALGDFLRENVTLSSVRGAYARGEFSHALIHKDARRVLEGVDPP